MSASTFRQIMEPALRKAGVTASPGFGSGPDKEAEMVLAFNRILDKMNVQPKAIYETQQQTLTLTANLNPHTWGPGGTFNISRPLQIDFANIVLSGSSPQYLYPLAIWTKDQYQQEAVPNLTSTYPMGFYIDGGNPLQSLYFWPVPTVAYQVIFWTWLALKTNFTAATDAFVFPPGYEAALVNLLAVEACQLWGKAVPPDVRMEANASYESISRMNEVSNYVVNDYPSRRGMDFDWRTGMGIGRSQYGR